MLRSVRPAFENKLPEIQEKALLFNLFNMKKIFTLITMLVAVVTGSQAASYIPTTTKTFTVSQTIILKDDAATAKAEGWMTIPAESFSDKTIVQDPDGEIDPPSGNVSCLQVKADGNVFNSKKRVVHMLVTGVSGVKVIGQANTGRGFQIGATPYTSSTTETSSMVIVAGSGEMANPVSYNGLNPEDTYIVSVLADQGDTYLYAVRFTVPAADAPAINAAGTEIMATESGVAATQEIEISGVNLTGSTLTAELSPAVEGLSVELASTAITAGSIETTATISYTSTVNVDEGTTTLVLSDGTTTKEVTITYSAFVAAYEQESISETTTWDFTKDVTGHVQYANDNREERLYANIPELEYASTFNAKALTFEGEYPERESKYAQNGTLRFNTTVPGTVEVTFSNTGGNNNDRYLEVNGVRGEVEAEGTTQNTETFSVGAGDVVITNVAGTEGGTVALRYYKVVFTPVAVEVTIGNAGAASFSSTSALDFTNSDVYAYIITGRDGTNFTKERVYQVPANTGVIVAASEADTYLVPVAAEEPAALEGNLLEATSTGEYTVTAADYGTVYGLFKSSKTGKVGFQKKKEGYTFGANKSYLRMPAGTSANEIFFDFDVTNAISNVAVETEAANSTDTYNLNGQKVNSSFRGVVIRGGKKLVQK